MIISGVEEAGRGPVIGPMVMAIAAIDEKDQFKLQTIGVKDSKLLTPKQRKEMFVMIKGVCKYKIIVLSNKEVDKALKDPNMNLNKLEGKTSAKLINSLKPDKVMLDCPSTNPSAYVNYVKKFVTSKTEVKAEHKADINHPIVSAASILAKVTRDEEIEKLKKKHKVNFGSGYPSDPLTIKFVEENWNKYDFFRKTWDTHKKIAKMHGQQKLF
jgi:ribonuclease HII